MQVSAINHVNILTDDLEATVGFYERLLGLSRGESPGNAIGFKGAWMLDSAGNAIVHLGWKDPQRDYGGDHVVGAPTGALHHVAFTCQGFDNAVERIEAMGVEFRTNSVAEMNLRQIVLKDPNNINLELNFAGE